MTCTSAWRPRRSPRPKICRIQSTRVRLCPETANCYREAHTGYQAHEDLDFIASWPSCLCDLRGKMSVRDKLSRSKFGTTRRHSRGYEAARAAGDERMAAAVNVFPAL